MLEHTIYTHKYAHCACARAHTHTHMRGGGLGVEWNASLHKWGDDAGVEEGTKSVVAGAFERGPLSNDPKRSPPDVVERQNKTLQAPTPHTAHAHKKARVTRF
jgi:hypothetical protein